MMGFFFRLYRGFLRRFLLQSNQYTTASAAVKPARECSLTWMQTKAIPVSAAAENCRLAAGDTFSQSPAVSGTVSPSRTTLPLAGEDAVDLLVLLVGVDKGDAGTGGELVDADLRAGETQGLVEFDSAFVADIGLYIVFHHKIPPKSSANFRLLDYSLGRDPRKNKYALFYNYDKF